MISPVLSQLTEVSDQHPMEVVKDIGLVISVCLGFLALFAAVSKIEVVKKARRAWRHEDEREKAEVYAAAVHSVLNKPNGGTSLYDRAILSQECLTEIRDDLKAVAAQSETALETLESSRKEMSDRIGRLENKLKAA